MSDTFPLGYKITDRGAAGDGSGGAFGGVLRDHLAAAGGDRDDRPVDGDRGQPDRELGAARREGWVN